ncbi:MAG: tRNA (adenosine(37)-N6)-threonylcarbamoyltransferase complex dimerization subunit type 1 TsaB [Wenzhouxiangella sp.]|jgi:tRNA threonylcarbamoyladenosine biosynthesis protein TsaB|nr:tRNA (adenosine(37)-N6)-threonylcarbamoyltransferase complex dimerization subunit type 1 TsaB [Wenzhouxiangella sp.]
MITLGLETATPMCSVALAVDHEVLSRRQLAPRGHAQLVLPWIEELLAECGLRYADIDRLAVGQGPGGFTSLRIGLGIVQGIALAHDLPVTPVSSLAALAFSAGPSDDGEPVVALMDARMGEVFVGWFQFDSLGFKALAAEAVAAPDAVMLSPEKPWRAVGSGLAAYSEVLRRRLGNQIVSWRPEAFPVAEAVVELSAEVEPLPAWKLEPNYVRNQVTQG